MEVIVNEIRSKEEKINMLIPPKVSRESDIQHPFIVMRAPNDSTIISLTEARMRILKLEATGRYDGGSLRFGYMKDGVILDLKRDLKKGDKDFLQVGTETIKHFLEIPLNNKEMPPVEHALYYATTNQYNGFYSGTDLMGASIVAWFSSLPQPQNFLIGCVNVSIGYDAGPWALGWEHFGV